MTYKERLQAFKELVDNHDLYYAFSDDHRVWSSGEASWRLLDEAAKNIPYIFVTPEVSQSPMSWLNDEALENIQLISVTDSIPSVVPGTETRFKQFSNAYFMLVKPSCPQLSTLTSFSRSEFNPP